MKIATYNVRNLFDPGTSIDETRENIVEEDFFNRRVTYLIEQLRPLDLDIICFQEIGGEKGVTTIADALGYKYFFAKPNSRGIRMAVMYKKEIEEKVVCSSISFGDIAIPSVQKEGDTKDIAPIAQRRDVLVIDYKDYQGKDIRVVTFHLKSMLPMYLENEDTENDRKAHSDAKLRSVFFKIMELRALRAYVEKTFEEGKEVILLGDFNEDHNASSLSVLKSSNDEKGFLYDVLTGYKGDKTTHMYRGNKLTFDTIIVSDFLSKNIKEVNVYNEYLKDYSMLMRGEVEHVVEPDHGMVVLDLN